MYITPDIDKKLLTICSDVFSFFYIGHEDDYLHGIELLHGIIATPGREGNGEFNETNCTLLIVKSAQQHV